MTQTWKARSAYWKIRRDPPPPDAPTDSLPGTAERVRCYRDRLASGRHLYHALDRTLAGFSPRAVKLLLGNGCLKHGKKATKG